MPLNSGTKLGPYEVQAPLGAGGMGEVYRARDTRLDRTVAIKVLPQSMAQSTEFRQRFEREARAISALQHPNICTLFDVGSQDGTEYLVMECLEGETLGARLVRGPLANEQVIKLGAEIARALAVAHRQGIVHRDLKPGNIMLTKTGPKLMDFGLAKPLVTASAKTPPAFTATMTMPGSPVTVAGTVVGTVQYMSPEQIQGQEADARSDIFSLGCVLYEMATGKHAFEGKSQLSIASAILEKDPEPLRLAQPLAPRALERIIARCLQKDPDARWQSAADLAMELADISQETPATVAPPEASSRWKTLFPWAIAALALIALAGFVSRNPANAPQSRILEAYLPAPEGTNYVLAWDESGPPVISPDGRNVAFSAVDKAGTQRIWVRQLSGGDPKSLIGTDDAIYPFWSPDSKSLGFFSNGRLRIIPVAGGPIISVCNVGRARGASWGEDGTILLTPDIQSPIMRVAPTADAIPVPASKLDPSVHTSHRWPVWLPGGKNFLYLGTNHSQPEASATNGIFAASLDGKINKFLFPSSSDVVLAGDYLLFIRDSSLLAQKFDTSRLQLQGDPHLVVDHVYRSPSTWHGIFDVSADGTLIYVPGGAQALSHLDWFDDKGNATGQLGQSDNYYDMRLSPDGQHLAIMMGAPNTKLAVIDVKTSARQRLEFDRDFDTTPVWSPDGRFIAFAKRRQGVLDIYRKQADGSKDSELLYSSPENKMVTDWSPDGKFLLFQQRVGSTTMQTWLLPLEGDRKPRALLAGAYEYLDAHISPDRKWISYTSNQSGGTDVFISSYPDLAGKWQISTRGGEASHWQRDGKALYYLAAGRTINRVDLSTEGGTIKIKSQQAVVNAGALVPLAFKRAFSYDVMPDSKHLLVNAQAETPEQLTLVTNWTELLPK